MVVFPAVAPGDDIEVSATTFVAYLQCPEQAAARLRGEYGPDSVAAFVGGLSHRIFARHLRDGPIDGDVFGQACREEIGSGLNHKLGSLGLKPSRLGGLIAEVGDLYDRFKRISFTGFAGAEVALEAHPAPGVRLYGTIDAVFGDGERAVRLVDWKTGGIPDSGEAQLGFYALLWALQRGEAPAGLEAVSVRTGQRQEARPTPESLAATAVQVAELVSCLRRAWAEGATMERRGGGWCRYCPLQAECVEGRAALEVLAVR